MTKMNESKGTQPGTLPIRSMAQIANSILPFDDPSIEGKVILDVGCGPGQVTGHLLEVYGRQILSFANENESGSGEIRVKASDFSVPMVAQLQARARTERRSGNRIWECVDAQDLAPVAGDGEASHVFASLVLFMLPEPCEALRGIKRVLMDGGMVVCSSWKESEWMEMMRYGSTAPNPDSAHEKVSGGFEVVGSWASTNGVREELEKAGFGDVDVREVAAEWSFECYEEIVGIVLGFPGMQAMFGWERWSGEGRERVRVRMDEWVRERCPGLPGVLRGVSVVGVGKK